MAYAVVELLTVVCGTAGDLALSIGSHARGIRVKATLLLRCWSVRIGVTSMTRLVASPVYPYPINRGDKLRWRALLSRLAALEPLRAVFGFTPGRDERSESLERLFSSVQIVPGQLRDIVWRSLILELTGRPSVFGRFASESWRSCVLKAADSASSVLVLGPNAWAIPALPAPTVVDLCDVKGRVRILSGDRVEKKNLLAELSIVRRFPSILATACDRDWLIGQGADGARLTVVPNGVDPRLFSASADPSSRILLFVGNFGYRPNRDGLRWFLRRCWPALRERQSGLVLRVVGYDADRLRKWSPTMEVYPNVADMLPHYQAAAIAIAPLDHATGVQNKVLEAMAVGLPVVCTSPVARGLFDDHPAVVADDSDAFVEECQRFISDRDRRAALGSEGRDYARRHHDWTASTRLLSDALRDAER